MLSAVSLWNIPQLQIAKSHGHMCQCWWKIATCLVTFHLQLLASRRDAIFQCTTCFAIIVGRDFQVKPQSWITRSKFPLSVRQPTVCCWTCSSLLSRPTWMLKCNPHHLLHFHRHHLSLLLHHLKLTWNPLHQHLLCYLRLTWWLLTISMTNHLSRKPCYHHFTPNPFLNHPKFLGMERPTWIFLTKMNMQMPDRLICTILLHLNRSGN